MITDEDIKKLAKKFATKNDLQNIKLDLAKVEFNLRTEIEEIKEKMATKDDFRRFMTVLEKTFTEVKKMREEQSAHFGEHRLINDRLDDIERVPVVAHELSSPT